MTERYDRVLDFLAGDRWINVSVDGKAALMGVLPALEVLRARREAAKLMEEDENGDKGLYTTAALLARCLYTEGGKMFADARDLLEKVSVGSMASLGEKMLELNSSVNVSPAEPEQRIKELRTLLGDDAYQRLRWQVMRSMGALPSEQRVKDMTDGDYMYCILNMWLDREEELESLCPQCRRRAMENTCRCCGGDLMGDAGVNESFDEEKFRELMNR